MLVEAVSVCVEEVTFTLDLAAREAGDGMALAAAVSASKSRLSRFIPLRSTLVLVNTVEPGTVGVANSGLHSMAVFAVISPFPFWVDSAVEVV